MSAPKVYGLILGLAFAAAAGVETASSAGRHAVAVAAEETWTIPGAGRTPGQNNTFFVSDLALTNLGGAAANVTIAFVGPGGLPVKPITIAAGATTAYRDILNALWSASGLVGALSVESDQPLVLRARTYNTAATGTFGVALPVFASKDLLEEGGSGDSIWVQQSPTAGSGFRTNVGVVFPDDGGGEAVVTFYDAAGAVTGSLTYSSASAGFQQQAAGPVLAAGLPVGRAQILVSRGRAAGYAVGVDNITGDTSLYSLEALPAGVQDVVVSGVARLTGRNNTFFRTDARFYNPTPEEATVTASFHAAGTANPAPPTATVTVPAGRLVEAVDVLDSVLHLPVGSGGAVRFRSDQPVAILARTSNVDPQGVQPGTFGAQQKPVLVASYLSSADAGAVVTAIRQDASFRTNVGFAAGPDGAAYVLTLKNAQGTVIAVTTGSLGVFGWAQPSVADLFPGTTIPPDASVLVQVTSGTIDVYDASLDNASGDLVVTPISPIPGSDSVDGLGRTGGREHPLGRRPPDAESPGGHARRGDDPVGLADREHGAERDRLGLRALAGRRRLRAPRAARLCVFGRGPRKHGCRRLSVLRHRTETTGSRFSEAPSIRSPAPSSSRSRRRAPGPAAAGGGRLPMSPAANGNLGPYGSVRIDPERTAVPVNGTKTFALTFVGPSSTGNLPVGFGPLRPGGLAQNASALWSVADIYGAGAGVVGQITTSSRTGATYVAPSCPPRGSDNPVRINVTVALSALGAPYARIGAWVRIVERDWQIETIYRQFAHCGGIGLPGVGVWTHPLHARARRRLQFERSAAGDRLPRRPHTPTNNVRHVVPE